MDETSLRHVLRGSSSIAALVFFLLVFLSGCDGDESQEAKGRELVRGKSQQGLGRSKSRQTAEHPAGRESKIVKLRQEAGSDLARSFSSFNEELTVWNGAEGVLFEQVYGHLLRSDNKRFILAVMQLDNVPARGVLVNLAITYLADLDHEKAISVLGAVPPSLVEEESLSIIVESCLEKNPKDLPLLIGAVPELKRDSVLDSVALIMATEISSRGRTHDFPSSVFTTDSGLNAKLFSRLTKNGICPETVAGLEEWREKMENLGIGQMTTQLYSIVGDKEPEIAVRILDEDARDVPQEAKAALLVGLSEGNPEQACRLGAKLDSEWIPHERLIESWLGRDSIAASKWVGSLPQGQSRDRAIHAMIKWLESKGNTREAELWISVVQGNGP